MGHVKRVGLIATGAVVLLTGVALLVLPGPGLLLVFAGVVLLGRAVPSVARFEEPVRLRALRAAEDSVASPWRVAGSVLAGLGLLGAGVVVGLGVLPWLPFTGWSAGSSLLVSGLVLFALLGWSWRRVRAQRRADAGRR
ncbi:PGPGW domain-containing protein [Streptomyces sp. TRM70308]|uniref:PGPGW domain-containing protein n=1 Tax=Streptomyces sp. TRM70308 TaxID=3131932 RepID=UPI003D093914